MPRAGPASDGERSAYPRVWLLQEPIGGMVQVALQVASSGGAWCSRRAVVYGFTGLGEGACAHVCVLCWGLLAGRCRSMYSVFMISVLAMDAATDSGRYLQLMVCAMSVFCVLMLLQLHAQRYIILLMSM